MKVAMIIRSTAFSVSGGDSVQAQQTAANLRNLGVQVDIFPANADIPYRKYDLLHLFNIIRPADHLKHIDASNLPFVVSPIYVDYSEFDRFGRTGWSKYIFSLSGKHGAEYLKSMLRFLKGQDSLVGKRYLFGHLQSMKYIWKRAAAILPNSNSEYQRLQADFKTNRPYFIIPNGVDQTVFSTIPEVERRENHVICVGQIYGRKNQHRLIEVCNKLGLELSIIGKSPPNHTGYLEYCKSIAGKNVTFYDFMPQQELLKHYASAAVHALPSWFETTGLSSLEAAAMGCNTVVGYGGDTRDYFKPVAAFCYANDIRSIESALLQALDKKCYSNNSKYILENFTWETAAIKTLLAYQAVLNHD